MQTKRCDSLLAAVLVAIGLTAVVAAVPSAAFGRASRL